MSLLGLDIGTTGCKAAVFSTDGRMLASAYEEYNILSPQPGWVELDTLEVWEKIKRSIAGVVSRSSDDPVTSLAVSSLGEAVIPVDKGREVLGPSILNFDSRGEEYLERLGALLEVEHLYRINGNTLGNQYSLTKLMWIKEHQTGLYAQTYKFLHWSSFVAFMLGADPVLDYSLANRTLLFDIDRETWSDEMIGLAGIDRARLPVVVPSGTPIGFVNSHVADELGLSPTVAIVAGAHDQCANAVGCGVIEDGLAVYGMGTYHCITPVFSSRREPSAMLVNGLSTEHHAVPGRFVCFIYNHGGTLVKWFRDTFAAVEHRQAQLEERDIYSTLVSEMPERPSSVVVLPYFAPTGTPRFLTDNCGVVAGLHLDTSRGDILKGIIEGITFYLKECVVTLPATGIAIHDYRAVGGGSRSNAWIQICADILGQPISRPEITEAGALGAAMMAGVGSGVFPTYAESVAAMVRLERTFEPDPKQHERYADRFELYKRLSPLIEGYLKDMHLSTHKSTVE
jgi:xylulokinase